MKDMSSLFRRYGISLRRAIAAVVLLCVGVMTFEQFATDVCDDAAPHDAEVTTQSVSADAHAKPLPFGKTTSKTQDLSHPGMHVCHCLHGHFGTLPVRQVAGDFFVCNNRTFDEPVEAPPSIALDPPHRPPVRA